MVSSKISAGNFHLAILLPCFPVGSGNIVLSETEVHCRFLAFKLSWTFLQFTTACVWKVIHVLLAASGWHFCAICTKAANFQCYTCPTAYCAACLAKADFYGIRQRKGLCEECWPIVQMIEKKETVNLAEGVCHFYWIVDYAVRQ